MKAKYIFILSFLIFPFIFISCASSYEKTGHMSYSDYAPSSSEYSRDRVETKESASLAKLNDEDFEQESSVTSEAISEDTRQKIIYTAYINLGVYDAESIKQKIIEALRNFGGFVEVESNMNIILRIPVDSFNQMVEEIIKYGRVITKNISAMDVTEEFYDLAARLKVKKEALEVLQELLKNTESPTLQLEILREIRVLQEEIERTEAALKYLSDKVSFSTIMVQLTLERQIRKAPSHVRIPVNWLNLHSLEKLIN